jgi:hypothetical protein
MRTAPAIAWKQARLADGTLPLRVIAPRSLMVANSRRHGKHGVAT